MSSAGVTLLVVGIGLAAAVWFVLIWCLTVALTANLSGWSALAQRYPLPLEEVSATGQRFRNATLFAGRLSRYRNCVDIAVRADGIALATISLFRFKHPPLLIPWSAVTNCYQEEFRSGAVAAVEIAEPIMVLRFPEEVGRAVLARCHEARTSS